MHYLGCYLCYSVSFHVDQLFWPIFLPVNLNKHSMSSVTFSPGRNAKHYLLQPDAGSSAGLLQHDQRRKKEGS